MRVIGALQPLALPAVPTGLSTTVNSAGLVRLVWSASGDAESWDVYRDDVLLGNVAVPTFDDDTVAASTAYDYKIRAVNSTGASAFTDVLEVTTAASGAPATPTGLALEQDATAYHVLLSWDLAADAEEWDVERDSVVIATVTAPAYEDLDITELATYDYTIVARNAAGDSAATDPLEVTIPENVPPSWQISGAVNSTLGASFELDLRNGSSDGDGHPLTYTVNSGSLPPGIQLVGSTLVGQFSGLGEYAPVIRADDGIDTADLTFTFTIIDPDFTAPSVPGNVAAVANGDTVTCTSTGSTDLSGIRHYRAFRNGAFRQTFSSFPYIESGLPNGSYTFSFSAVDNSANANESAQAAAEPVTVNVTPGLANPPINFTAIALPDGTISLSWEPSPSGPVPIEYLVEMDTVPDPDDLLNWANVVLQTGTSYVVTTDASSGGAALIPGTTYYFKVKARAVAGQPLSGSTQAQATTQGSGAGAATKIVQKDGAGGAFTTIQSAINAAVAGDIIEVRSNTPGTETVFTEVLTITNKVGTAAQPITMRVRVGDTVKLRPNNNNADILAFSNSRFWTFDAQVQDALSVGDTDLYSPLAAGYGYTYSRPFSFTGNCTNIWFKKTRFSGARSYNNTFASRAANLICFDDCTFEKHGRSAVVGSPDGSPDDSVGDGFDVFARRILLRNCNFNWYGGHNMVSLEGCYSAWIGGTIRGDWQTLIPARATGYRQAILNAGDVDRFDTNDEPGQYGPIVMDGVYWDRLGDKEEPQPQGGFKTNTYNLIVRGNLFADCDQPPWGGGNFAAGNGVLSRPVPNCGLHRFYNNTIYLAKGLWRMQGAGWTTQQADDVFADGKFFNNLVELTGDVAGVNWAIAWSYSPMPAAGMDAWRRCEWAHNRFDGTSPSGFGARATGQNIPTLSGSMATLQTNYPANFHDNTTTNIVWANTGTPGARTFAIKPASGAGLGDAAPLTTIAANATNSTVVQMADASWFCDFANPATWNMGYFGMVGDDVWIGTSIGTAVKRRIVAINRTNYNTAQADAVTLDSAITVTSGMSVWWGGNPSSRFSNQIWDNKGAGQ